MRRNGVAMKSKFAFSEETLVHAVALLTALMGVVNLSADSWYRESVCLTVDSAVQRGRVLRAQGEAHRVRGDDPHVIAAQPGDRLVGGHRTTSS